MSDDRVMEQLWNSRPVVDILTWASAPQRTPFSCLAVGNEDGLRPPGPLMLPGATAVPANSNPANIEYVKYDITVRG